MRLTCPNCGAQYEIPEEVIPDEGRDVQCSSCGHTWYQLHPAQEAAIEANRSDHGMARSPDVKEIVATAPPVPKTPGPVAVPGPYDRSLGNDEYEEDQTGEDLFEPALTPPAPETPRPAPVNATVSSLRAQIPQRETPVPQPTQEPGSRAAPTPAPQDSPAPPATQHTDHDVPEARMIEITDDDEDDYDFSFDDDFPANAAEKPRRELDPRVRDVLKAEAEREARVRAQEQGSLESQPELGLDEPETVAAGRKKRETDVASGVAAAATAAAATVGTVTSAQSRRDLLPDIDEINSTLRSTSDRRAGLDEDPTFEEVEEVERKRSFGLGFRLALLLVLVLAALYIFGPRLIEAVPATSAIVQPYIDTVDAGRVWLDGQVSGLMGRLDALSSEAATE